MTDKKRNILFITLGDQTGANTALIDVANALSRKGHNVQVLVRDKGGQDPLITKIPARERFFAEPGFVVDKEGRRKRIRRDPKYIFNTVNEENSYQDTNVTLRYLRFNPHIIFVGITFDFLTSTDILKLSEATQAVVYNVAVDMNHLTGGCHFAWDCDGYIKGCDTKECPAILDEKFKGLAGENFRIKKDNAEKGSFKILAGTAWTLKQARESLIYKGQKKIYNIPGIVDTSIYNTKQRSVAKHAFELSEDKFYILAGAENAEDQRKGYAYFVETVNRFWERLSTEERERVEILYVSRILNEQEHEKIRFAKRSVPYIKDDRLLSLLYQAADVYVNSSLEDSGPSMLIQAMACGTPIVSFEMGAAGEYVFNGSTGFIVKNRDAEALSVALMDVFRMSLTERKEIGLRGHSRVEEVGSLNVALDTVEEILALHKEDFKKFDRKVSVAMCTYNGEKYLAEQLESIMTQNLMPAEVVICDDTSSDRTLEILETYQEKYPNVIKIHRNDKRLGVVKNFEKAIGLCSHELIFLCDQDDEWVPYKTEAIVRIFNNNPEIEAVSHNLQICYKDKHLADHTMWDTMGFRYFLWKGYADADLLFHILFFGNVVTGAGLCIKKPNEPLKFVDTLPEIIHDYQMAIKYLSKDTMYFQDECLGLYRQHEAQQIGPKLEQVQEYPSAIQTYYETNNPLWNIAYIQNAVKTTQVFTYLEGLKDPAYKKMVAKHIKLNIRNLFKVRGLVNRVRGFTLMAYGKMKRVGFRVLTIGRIRS